MELLNNTASDEIKKLNQRITREILIHLFNFKTNDPELSSNEDEESDRITDEISLNFQIFVANFLSKYSCELNHNLILFSILSPKSNYQYCHSKENKYIPFYLSINFRVKNSNSFDTLSNRLSIYLKKKDEERGNELSLKNFKCEINPSSEYLN